MEMLKDNENNLEKCEYLIPDVLLVRAQILNFVGRIYFTLYIICI